MPFGTWTVIGWSFVLDTKTGTATEPNVLSNCLHRGQAESQFIPFDKTHMYTDLHSTVPVDVTLPRMDQDYQ